MSDSRLQRPLQPMPDDIALLLNRSGLRDAYDQRPAYQRNDYLGWIARAKRDETRLNRIAQMVEELANGGVYMGMPHSPSGLSHKRIGPWIPDLTNVKRASKHETEMRWLADNEGWLEKTCPGRWVAVKGNTLVGVGVSFGDAAKAAKDAGIEDPVISPVKPREFHGMPLVNRWR